MHSFDEVLNYISKEIAALLYMLEPSVKSKTSEIRIRANKHLAVTVEGNNHFVSRYGEITSKIDSNSYLVDKQFLYDCFMLVCNGSIYAHEDELSNCFVTLKNGSRVGIFGDAIFAEGKITSYRNVTSLNYRIPRQIIGCANPIKSVVEKGRGIIICGPPASSKTTTLRDLIRMLASGECGGYKRVCVIDSRNEIAASFNGNISMDLGETIDVLTIPDTELGIEAAIRVMNPEYIAVDEIMSMRETRALIKGVNCGVKLILTAHVGKAEEILQKENIKALIECKGIDYAVFIENTFSTPKIIKL